MNISVVGKLYEENIISNSFKSLKISQMMNGNVSYIRMYIRIYYVTYSTCLYQLLKFIITLLSIHISTHLYSSLYVVC